MVASPKVVEAPAPVSQSAGVTAVCLDFEAKTDTTIGLDEVPNAQGPGRFVWMDVDLRHPDAARLALERLPVVGGEVLRDVLGGDPSAQLTRHEHYYHMTLVACRFEGERFEQDRVDVVLGEHFMLTAHRGRVAFLDVIGRHFRADFHRFARSASFLVFEVFDHLLEAYLVVRKRFEERVFKLQSEMMRDVDDAVFAQISALGTEILQFRKILLPLREMLNELSTRRSIFVSEATQEYLEDMVGTVDRVLQDLLSDRDILSDSLNLHMTIVGHRTNRVMNRLSVVSIIFLPLTFLCGVYGMNFEVFPETKWRYGYPFFWTLVVSITTLLVWILRRRRLL